ncbi:DUF2971 domain-containing protein [Vibrio lentus]|nr:DUF2971 domain-containing protein [Vibrio lentus]PMH62336.1 hypothetical protein BCU64_03430 [Vibrio lentus]
MLSKPHIKFLYHYQSMTLDTASPKAIRDRAIYLEDDFVLDRYKLEPLLARKAWYSSPLQFNDPFEGEFNFDLASSKGEQFIDICSMASKENILNEKMTSHAVNVSQLPQQELVRQLELALPFISRTFKDVIKRIVGIYCMSSTPKQATMWAHYGGNHQGIALEFERNESNICGLETYEVDYFDEPPLISFSKVLNEVLGLRPQPGFERMDTIGNSELKKLLYNKTKQWEYEAEWRSHQGSPGLHDMPGKLTAIVFGTKAPSCLVKYLMAQPELKNIKFKFLVTDKNRYEFKVVDHYQYMIQGALEKNQDPDMSLFDV